MEWKKWTLWCASRWENRGCAKHFAYAFHWQKQILHEGILPNPSAQFLNSATNSKAQPKEETSLVNDNQYDEVWTTWCKQKMTFLIFFFGFWFFLLYLTMIHRFFFCCVDFFKIFCTLLVFKTRSIYKRNIQKRESPEVVTCL